jgi:hypothetical protein
LSPPPICRPVPAGVGDGLDEHGRQLDAVLGEHVPGPAPDLEELGVVDPERPGLDLRHAGLSAVWTWNSR